MPCKHLAATFYLLAEAFDDDPFLILRWRGRDREPLLGRLRELRGDHAAGADAPAEMPRAGAAGILADLRWPDPDPSRFWQPPPPLPPRPATLDVEPEMILRQLPEPPAILGGASFSTSLTKIFIADSARGHGPTKINEPQRRSEDPRGRVARTTRTADRDPAGRSRRLPKSLLLPVAQLAVARLRGLAGVRGTAARTGRLPRRTHRSHPSRRGGSRCRRAASPADGLLVIPRILQSVQPRC